MSEQTIKLEVTINHGKQLDKKILDKYLENFPALAQNWLDRLAGDTTSIKVKETK